jgi:hypothetical protein
MPYRDLYDEDQDRRTPDKGALSGFGVSVVVWTIAAIALYWWLH